MKIYTRAGDQGMTCLMGGKATLKHEQRVVAYGTVDELNGFIGLAAVEVVDLKQVAEELEVIQHLLFDCGADLATPEEAMGEGRIEQCHVDWLEARIDHYTSLLPPIQHFILPGGTRGASYLHVARTIARRAEREVVALFEREAVQSSLLSFMNRLSDYLFTMARYVNEVAGVKERQYLTSSSGIKLK